MSKVEFTKDITLIGDITLEGDDSDSTRIWLGQSIGDVTDGVYKGTGIIAPAGGGIAVYVQRNGKRAGTILINLGSLVKQAIDIFEEKEAANV